MWGVSVNVWFIYIGFGNRNGRFYLKISDVDLCQWLLSYNKFSCLVRS